MPRSRLTELPQTPTGDQVFLDHVGWFVPDIGAAARQFERLGFRLTPFVAQHNADPAGGAPRPAGTGNRCAMLQRGYLEILTAIPGAETPLAAQLKAAIGRYTGLHLIAFTVADASAAHARLEAEGFAPQPPVHLRRPLDLPGGAAGEAAFTVIRVPPEAMPEGRIQMLVQETPDAVWHDALLTRDNGVAGLAGVLLCVDDPLAVSGRYARFTGCPAAGSTSYRVIELDRGRLAFATPARCRQILPGIDLPSVPAIAAAALEADDPEAIRRLCAERQIATLPAREGALRIAPAGAAGAVLVITAPGDEWPATAGER